MKQSKLRAKARAQFTKRRRLIRYRAPDGTITETPQGTDAVEVTLIRGRFFSRAEAARQGKD